MSTSESRRSREKLAHLLQQQMKAEEMSPEQLAEKANVWLPSVLHLLACEPNPSRPEISRIIQAVNFSKPNRLTAERYGDTFAPTKRKRKYS
jgi:hypothetical protein